MYYCTAVVSATLNACIREAILRDQLLLRKERNVILRVLPWKLETKHPLVLLNYVRHL